MDRELREYVIEHLTNVIQFTKDLENRYMTGEECVRFCMESVMRYPQVDSKEDGPGSIMVGDIMSSIVSTLKGIEPIRAELYELSMDTLKNIQKEELLKKFEAIQNECTVEENRQY